MRILHIFLILFFSMGLLAQEPNEKEGKNAKEEKEEDTPDVTVVMEVVSDFIWRGANYGGQPLAYRDNLKHSSYHDYWALQPDILLSTPLKGFTVDFWGNIPIKSLKDKDSDLRFLQAYPGGPEIDPFKFADNITNSLVNNDPTYLLSDPLNNIANNKCEDPTDLSSCMINPGKVKNRKEKNGMFRTGGLFTTFAYEWETKKLGTFTAGVWFYFQSDNNAKYTWHEYFIWWKLPFLKEQLNPMIYFYVEDSADPITTGGQYLSLRMNHVFFEEKFFRIEPSMNIGYKSTNNNTNQRQGVNDITSGLKFYFGDFFVTANHIYRPDIYLWDNDYQMPTPQGGVKNRSQFDGKVANPSKIYGSVNRAVDDLIKANFSNPVEQTALREKYQLQDIPKNLFYISFGYQFKI